MQTFPVIWIATIGLFFARIGISSPKEELNVGISKIAATFDIAFSRGAYITSVLKPLHRGLVKLDYTGQIASDLAYKWSISRDHRQYDFCIKREFFHDDSLIDFKSVEFSFKRLMSDEPSVSLNRPIINRLKPVIVEKVSSAASNGSGFCFSVKLQFAYSNFLHLLASPHMSIIPPQSDKNYFIGSGDYRLVSIDRTLGTMQYRRFSKKSSLNPGFETINFKVLEDPDEAVSQINKGKIDLYIGPTNFRYKPESFGTSVKLSHLETLSVSVFTFNMERKIFNDKKFRSDFAKLVQSIAFKYNRDAQPYSFSDHIVPKGLLPQSYYQKEFTPLDIDQFVKKWRGRIAKDEIVIVARFNQLDSQTLQELGAVLKKLGVKLTYLGESNDAARSAISEGKFDIVFGTWVAALDRAEEFLTMIQNLSGIQLKWSKELRSTNDKIKSLDDSGDANERIQKIQAIIVELETFNIIVPIFVIHTPIYHHIKIAMPPARWRYLPAVDQFIKK